MESISSSLTIVVAAYNEEEGIGPTLLELKSNLKKPNIIVIDGNSTDKTLELAYRFLRESTRKVSKVS